MYWQIAMNTCFTLFNTFGYTSLLLISKGFGLTQTALSRSDVTVTSMTMGVVYLCFSAIMLSPDRLLLLWFIMLLSLFYFIVRNSLHNLQILRGRLLELMRHELPYESLKMRVSMMTRFLIFVYAFFLSQLFVAIIFNLALSIDSGLNDIEFLTGNIILQSSILLSLTPMFYTFRARDLGLTYTESLNSLSQCQVAPVFIAKVNFSDDTSTDLNEDKDAPVVLLPPQDSRVRRILVGLAQGTSISRRTTR
eukprot:CAMPEP_0204908224 /NCGR_PEP_ID=MMETSP1397-20131031/7212_1 /ASSEMBLY_ACC=CAM_ASM_000891 /TAXON_ID=49980 /ORGANISM="Climacostomum Climacostomum virens, Strain Stock W-24" /LENGTH=249 /DNA_ID=CAMNT_0052077661 /DNA_START=132 /DNA_END=878 /DNA_ORIENTATION=+